MKTKPDNFWTDKNVCITGGAAMIGSHLAETLLEHGVEELTILDDLSSGSETYIPEDVWFHRVDLRDYNSAYELIAGNDIVFHLAAAHGGRAFVDTHALECWQNFELDTTVFRACADVGVGKVVYMSSACAYDTQIQQDTSIDLKLSETLIDYKSPIVPDGAYGEEKYVAEKILRAYANRNLFKGVVARGFTVYGARVSLTHFIGAAIARTMIRQDPLVIFGDGNQRRNWTMVRDSARGLMLAAEKMDDGVVNLGTEEMNTPNTVYPILWELFGWKPNQITYTNELVGTLNRVADASYAKQVLGWEPQYDIRHGLEETVDWFKRNHTIDELKDNFEEKLFER